MVGRPGIESSREDFLTTNLSFSNSQTPLGQKATSIYEDMEKNGHDNLDFSGVIKLLKNEL